MLVFLHGFLGNATDWDEVIAHLPNLPTMALNLPGHGHTPFTPNFSEFLLKSTQHLSPFHLIGYSMGGRLALQFAARYPEKIGSLTLISAHLGLKTGHEARLASDQAVAQKLLSLGIDEFLQVWYDQSIFKTLVSKRDIRAMRKEQNIEDLANALMTYSLGHQPDLSHLPKQLIAGEFDEVYRAHYEPFAHTVVPDAGHAIHLENPKTLAGVLYDNFR